MTFDEIIAQPAAVRMLRKAVEARRLASSYLFEGPSGVGKQRAALALTLAVLCPTAPGKGCGRCETCRRILGAKHPDVRVFEPRDEGAGNLQVEVVRAEILPVAHYAPFEAGAAFLIFPRADASLPQAHPESANALLKTLEEPRPNVHFILLAERADRLLPTIRSRCQSVPFGRLPPAVLERILVAHGVAEARREAAIALADGRADRALELADGERSEPIVRLALRVDACVESGKTGALVDVAEDLARSEDCELALETLATYYRDIAAKALGVPDDKLAFRMRAAEVAERAARLSPERAALRVEIIRRTVDTFERNANREIALDAMLYRLSAT